MILQRIALERFQQLDGREYVFQPGLNLIKGPNEAGKTTLQTAILFALLGNPRHTTLDRVKRVADYISWGENRPFSITLDFTDEGETPYRLKKDWDAQNVCLTNLQTGARDEDIDSVHQTISEILGYGSLKLLQSTVCVEQDAIDEISTGQREISDQLQSIVTGGGTDEATVSAVLIDVGAKIAEMVRGWRTHAPRNPGPIKVKRDEIDDLKQWLSDIGPQVERVEQAKEQLITLETRIEEIVRELTPRRSLKEVCDSRFGLERERDEWQGREKLLETRIEQIEDAQKRIDQASEEIGTYSGFDTLELEAEQQLQSLHQRVEILREDNERKSANLEQLKTEQPTESGTRPGLPVVYLVGAGTGFVLLLIGVAVGLTNSLPVGLLVGLLGLLMGIGCAIRLLTDPRRPPMEEPSVDITSREAELAENQGDLQVATAKLIEALDQLECTSWDEFSQKLAEYKRCLSQQEKAEIQRDTLLGDQTLEVLTEERRMTSRHRHDAVEALEEPEMQRSREITALQYETLKQAIEHLEVDLDEKKQKQRDYQIRSEVADYSIEDVHRLEEQKAVAERSLSHLNERLAVYQLARDVIEEAKEQTMRSARDQLEPRIGAHFRRITQGRYTRVEADDELRLSVFSQDKGDWIKAESGKLSKGTVDQLYLAVRLALLDLLFRDAKPPLLLDDPFVKFDSDRREQAMKLCKEISQDHQILFFTCHDLYGTVADWVVSL